MNNIYKVLPILAVFCLIIAIAYPAYGGERERRSAAFLIQENIYTRHTNFNDPVNTDINRVHPQFLEGGLKSAEVLSDIQIQWVYQESFNDGWINVERLYHLLDNAGRISEAVYQRYEEEWVNNDRDLYIYEGNNQHPSIIVWQDWDGFAWVNYERDHFEYDGEDRIVRVTIEEWYDGEWYLYEMIEATYNARGDFEEILWYYWDDEWLEDYRRLHEYDNDGNLIGRLEQYYFDEWVNERQSLYTYDAEGKQIEEIVQYWDDEWVDRRRTVSLYDDRGNVSEDTHYRMSDEGWLLTGRDRHLYDQNNVLLAIYMDHWDGGEYHVVARVLFGDHISVNVADDTEIPSTIELRQNYPNPFNPSTKIDFSLPSAAYVTLTVYDLLGREVAVLVNEEMRGGNHSLVFNASGLTSGIYIYQLRIGDIVTTKRMTFLK